MTFLTDGRADAAATFVFAHGAGGSMDSPFMTRIARGLAANAIRVVRFEFPYMRARREGKRTGAPDRQPVLLDTWREAVRQNAAERLFVGGKSLGGRMASMIADEVQARGLICLGYPFHPPGNRARLRVEHLRTLVTPTLIIQGSRDPFGTPEDVASYDLSASIRVEWLAGGDHSFKPRRGSEVSENGILDRAIELITAFIGGEH
ncbi:MAG TPA: alpha/beta family hydrolase [Thermoanaerobaculia bacterium]|nr:alpha/beta family hydrolase [Thermoanaerobaculia bacterium]